MIGDGYPENWETMFPGPWPLGMPIWLDSWGPHPPLVYYGNGTLNPGPLLPIQYIAETTIAFNAGLGPALEPLPIELMLAPHKATPAAEASMALPISTMFSNPFSTPSYSSGINRVNFNPVSFSNPTTYATPTYAASPSRAGDVISAASGLCDALPPAYKVACQAAAAVGSAFVGGGGSTALTQPAQCSVGWTWNATLGKCVQLANALPGGQPLTLGGGPVATTGGMGLTAVTPTQVGVIQRNDGSSGPILRCPRRYVLGMDYLCYPKSMIPNQLRAHPRGTRPLLTGGEVKILRRAKSLEKKVTKLGHQFGKKACHCSTKPTRRKK